jgi:N5-(cytidine 5'-diphosphoramidyl)-L-glutamine hydrolase
VKPPVVVAVSQRRDNVPNRDEQRDCLDQKLVAFLQAAGALAFPVPNGLSEEELGQWLAHSQPKAIVLSGGNDIGDVPARDRTERGLLDFARAGNLPALGICRGMQMMAVWGGCSLKPVEGHVRTRHNLTGAISGNVNSFHNFSISDCSTAFSVLARSEDGEIEALRHASLPWEAWMWHPEREPLFARSDLDRFRTLLAT